VAAASAHKPTMAAMACKGSRVFLQHPFVIGDVTPSAALYARFKAAHAAAAPEHGFSEHHIAAQQALFDDASIMQLPSNGAPTAPVGWLAYHFNLGTQLAVTALPRSTVQALAEGASRLLTCGGDYRSIVASAAVMRATPAPPVEAAAMCSSCSTARRAAMPSYSVARVVGAPPRRCSCSAQTCAPRRVCWSGAARGPWGLSARSGSTRSASGAAPWTSRAASPSPRACGRCKEPTYCSTTCQAADWLLHKAECRAGGPAVPLHLTRAWTELGKSASAKVPVAGRGVVTQPRSGLKHPLPSTNFRLVVRSTTLPLLTCRAVTTAH
jgi:hypothetical protein